MENKDEKYVEYLPFNAVNEFMRDDYRSVILSEVMARFESIPEESKKDLSRLISKFIKIPGFRNSTMAPAAMKARNAVSLFQKSGAFAGIVMESWTTLHPELKSVIWTVLSEKGWEPLPVEANRTKLPGFQIHWPKTDTFEVLQEETKKANPSLTETDDDFSLMAVWVGNRLPYDLFTEGEEKKEE